MAFRGKTAIKSTECLGNYLEQDELEPHEWSNKLTGIQIIYKLLTN